MARQALFALIALALAFGCSTREHTNPLDPENPETGGRPAGFTALAATQRVTLRWRLTTIPDLLGYRLERRGPSDPDYVEVSGSPFPVTQSSYDDLTVANDSTYSYRLSFVLAGGSTSEAAVTEAQPGPGAVWIVDAGTDRAAKLTPDGRAVTISVAAPDQPGFVRLDPSSGAVWASSRTLGIVAIWDEFGSLIGASSEFGAPGAIAPFPGGATAWIAQERFGVVTLWSLLGGGSDRADDLGLASDVVVTAAGGAWIADRSRSELVQIANDGTVLTTVELADRPWRLALDPGGGVWVVYTEAGVIEHRALDGSFGIRVEGFNRPFAIDVDEVSGIAWVVLAGEDAVVGLDAFGATVARFPVVEPRGVAVDSRLGEVWVCGFGSERGEVRRFGPNGEVRAVLQEFVRPFAIDFDPGRAF